MGNNVNAIWGTIGAVGVLAVVALIIAAIALGQQTSDEPIFKTKTESQPNGQKSACNCLSGGSKF